MTRCDRTDVPLSAQEYSAWAGTITMRVARRLRPLRWLIVWQMKQGLRLQTWCAGAAKWGCTRLATVCFALHRRFGARCGLFGRWAFACLATAQRCFGAESHLRAGLVALSASRFVLSVEPEAVSGDGNV